MILKPPKGAMVNRGHPWSRGLVGCWLINEGGGNLVNDLSGNGKKGTFVNSPTWAGGKYGPALKFASASSQYINYGNVLNMGANQDFTIVIDVHVSVVDKFECYIRKWDSTDGYFLGKSTTGAGIWYWVLEFDGTVIQGISTTTPTVGWHQLVFVVDRSAYATLYDNGVIVAGCDLSIAAHAAKDMTNASDLLIGGYSGWYVDDMISHYCIYNRALSATEMLNLYRSPFCMFEVDL